MSSLHTRWYIVPVKEEDNINEVQRVPKYIKDKTHVDGYAGFDIPETYLQGDYDFLISQFPNHDWYVIRAFAWGSTGKQALDEIGENEDCIIINLNYQFIINVAENVLGLSDSTIEEIENSFRVK